MALLHPVSKLDSGSGASTPRSDHHHDDRATTQHPRICFMCSFGGNSCPATRTTSFVSRYVGGDTRIVCVNRHTNFSSLLSKLSKLSDTINMNIKYQLPNEDLDALITVTSDENVENTMKGIIGLPTAINRLGSNYFFSRLISPPASTPFMMARLSGRAGSLTLIMVGR